MKYWPTKTAAAVHDRGLDWGPTLAKLGDPEIVSSAWTRLQGSAVAAAGTILANKRQTVTRVSGGVAGETTVFRNTVILSDGQVLDEDVFQKVRA